MLICHFALFKKHKQFKILVRSLEKRNFVITIHPEVLQI